METIFNKIEIGQGVLLKEGSRIAVLSIGSIAKNVTEAIEELRNTKEIAHYDMRFVKPLDESLLHNIFETYDTIITIEDGTIKGGFGSAILEFTSAHNYKNTIKTLGIPDNFIEHGKIDELQKLIGLDAKSLIKFLNKIL